MNTPLLSLTLLATAATWLSAQVADDQSPKPASSKPAPSASDEIRYSDKVPVLGDLPIMGALFRRSGSNPNFGARYAGWPGSATESTETILTFSNTDPGTVDETAEDLNILSFILSRNLGRALGTEGPDYKLGVPILLNSEGRSVRAFYLEGFGAVFQVAVRVPVIAPPTAEAKPETSSANLEWEKARDALYQRTPPGAANWNVSPYGEAEHFDARLPGFLKKQVIDSLRNAANLRHVKPDEWIAVIITGSSNPDSYSHVLTGPKGGKTASITGSPNSGGIVAAGSANADSQAGIRGETNDPLKEDLRISTALDKTAAGSESAATARATVMAIRIKKSAASALSAKDLSEDEFERQAEIITYLGRALPAPQRVTGYPAK
jgi:hypothetical protein